MNWKSIDEPHDDIENNRDEYTNRHEPQQKSFYEKYGFDERDGPPEGRGINPWDEEPDVPEREMT
jgi:hypothetical protein